MDPRRPPGIRHPAMESSSHSGSDRQYQPNVGRDLVGPTSPSNTPASPSPSGIINVSPLARVPPAHLVGSPPATVQGEGPAGRRRGRGRPRKHEFGGVASSSLPLVPLESDPEPLPNKKQKRDSSGTGGSTSAGCVGLALDVIDVATGEDIKEKILSFARGRKRTVVLSGQGTVSHVHTRISSVAQSSGFQGVFDILSLTGCFTQSEVNSVRGRLTVMLSVSFRQVLVGAVDAFMIASSPVQVFVLSSSHSQPANLLIREPDPGPSRGNYQAGGTSSDTPAGNPVIRKPDPRPGGGNYQAGGYWYRW